ncbi:MAG TPA: YceI family protein [Acidimicrobiales bacterium]|nr:YceI family protein [Acidimicrobiales bacterium]
MTTTTTTTSENSITALTGRYQIDAAHSRLGFVARHAMVTKVRGQFGDVDGQLYLDVEDPTRSTAEVTVQMKSISTGNDQRDEHLRSPDFFHVDEHPVMTFKSTKAESTGDDTYRLTGDLTIKGVSRPVTFDIEHTGATKDPWGNLRVGFEGKATINRKDWGLAWNAVLEAGGVMVSDKITIELDIAAVRPVEEAAA